MVERVRIVVAGTGDDAGNGDDHNAEALARTLRDVGSEVVYTGRQRAAEQIVHTAVQEDVVAIAILGAPEPLRRRVRELLDDVDATDVTVFAGAADDVVEWVREQVDGVDTADTGWPHPA